MKKVKLNIKVEFTDLEMELLSQVAAQIKMDAVEYVNFKVTNFIHDLNVKNRHDNMKIQRREGRKKNLLSV